MGPRDAYARWRPLIGEARRDALKRILAKVLTSDKIAAGAKHVAEKTKEQGFVAVLIEHSDDQTQFEQAIKDAGAIPVYERNREVLAVRFDTLLRIAEMHDFVPQDPKKIRAELKRVAANVEGQGTQSPERHWYVRGLLTRGVCVGQYELLVKQASSWGGSRNTLLNISPRHG